MNARPSSESRRPREATASAIAALVAFAFAIAGCGDPQGSASGDTGVDVEGGDAAPTDGGELADAGAGSGSGPGVDCTPAPLECVAPCIFNFAGVSVDRDSVLEVRVAASTAAGTIVAVEGQAFPAWIRFSDGFAQYLERVTADDWSVSLDGLTVEVGQPIALQPGESFAIELRADDPPAEPCVAGACGAVLVSVADCAGGLSTLTIPIAR